MLSEAGLKVSGSWCTGSSLEGSPGAVEQLAPALEQVSDPERIAAVADAVLECQTAEEFIVRAREAAGRRSNPHDALGAIEPTSTSP